MKIVMIAEKPSVAKTYAEALDLSGETKHDGYIEGHSKWDNNDYIITWSFGHLCTLSYPDKYDEKYKNWNFDDLPFLPDHYKYEVIKEKATAKQFKVIKELYHYSDVSQIVYAGDSGREGLYIQCLIKKIAGNNGHVTEKVLWIDSQTKEEIRKGLKEMKPLSAYDRLADSGFMRAIEDYAFGLNYSRMLTCKFGGGFNKKIKSNKWKPINVGRVMTCVLGMIVDREREIRDFTVTPFYKIFVNCADKECEFSADWLIDKDSKYYNSPLLYDNKGFKETAEANKFIAELSEYPTISTASVEDKTERKKAPLLYNLAELQNECSKRFKIDPQKTLEIAQKLYEGKLTTYPRTDARYLSTAISKEISNNLNGLLDMGYNSKYIEHILNFGLYSDIEKTQYCNDSKITDHYAIIPTGQGNTSSLSELELKVYQMIVNRFICIFLPQAEYNISTAILQAHNGEKFKISEKSLIKAGWMAVGKYKEEEDDEDTSGTKLSDFLKVGDAFNAEYCIEEGKTSPPKRYTSGSIILAMENAGNLIEDEELRAQIKGSGIGTSATRAGILEKLIKIGYICINRKSQALTPHTDGEAVYDIVKNTIPNFLSPKMTASWEQGLSMIEEGRTTRAEYKKLMEKEIRKTCQRLSAIKVKEETMDKFVPEDTGMKCPYCGKSIVTTSKGYKCEANLGKDKGCSFFVSEICGVKISEPILNQLLTNGTTDNLTFKKKNGSGTFDAMLQLNKDERKIEFKFANNDKPKSKADDTGMQCPFCKSGIVKTEKGFRCSKYGCTFFLSQIGGYTFTKENVKDLIETGKIGPMTFNKKNGNGTYNASLSLNTKKKKIEMEF